MVDMTTGRATGTVRHWSPATGTGVVDAPDLPGGCAVDASALGGGPLRAGQTVLFEWATEDGASYRVTRVVPDDEMGSAPGA